MSLLRNALRALAPALIIVPALAACSDSPPPEPVGYSAPPSVFGEVLGGIGRCYWADDVYEAQQLLASGACPAGWVPTRMPDYWNARYGGYYGSPAYVNVYVIPTHRVSYQKTETVWIHTHTTLIKTESSKAVHTTTPAKAAPTKAPATFAPGSGRQATFNGGSGRVASSKAAQAPVRKSGHS